MVISKGDEKFLADVAMPYFGIKALKVRYSASKKKWPDIWVGFEDVPVITVTEEWRRQSMHERRKRLTHEFCHLRGLEHGKYGTYDYNTKPELDTFSAKVYRDLA